MRNNKVSNINELKIQAMKKRGISNNNSITKSELQKITEERKNIFNKDKKIVQNKNQRKINILKSTSNQKTNVHIDKVHPLSKLRPLTVSKNQRKNKKNPYRNINSLPYKDGIISLKNKKITKLDLPHGCFNAGLAPNPSGEGYICVYRPDEYSFKGCFLDKDFQVENRHHHLFKFSNCADPRLIWVDNNKKLLMVYSSTSGVDIKRECIRGTIIMDLNKSTNFIDTEQFRISPEGNERHKNWMPFLYKEELYLISHVSPHKIYKFDLISKNCELMYENTWFSPWPIREGLRGNTNAVQLEDGNYISTFHTATWIDGRCHYDNGVYVFQGAPPFRVLRCSNKTFLPAEDAVEPHFRKANCILCPFPVGMVREGSKIIISYGDNDSCVKILQISLEDLEKIMLEVY